jgi:hypothetical protein
VADRLTREQQAAFDDGPPIDRRLCPSGEQTPEQARRFAVDSFRHACAFDGIDLPSEEAVEAAIDTAIATIHPVKVPRTEFRDIDGNVVATAIVGDDGVATIKAASDTRAANIIATNVIRPGPTVVTPHEGESYLRALPFAFRSPYMQAVFVAE